MKKGCLLKNKCPFIVDIPNIMTLFALKTIDRFIILYFLPNQLNPDLISNLSCF